jgi:branched-chain amino acid transport system substrate-binding protein
MQLQLLAVVAVALFSTYFWIDLSAYLSTTAAEIARQWILSAAIASGSLLVVAGLKRWVWFKAEPGKTSIPKILILLCQGMIHLTALLLILSLVFQRDITALLATSGIFAVILGYAAQSTLSEVISGLALSLSKPFKTGDSVQVDGIWGNVVETSWRSVTLRNYEGNLIVLPNSKISGMRLINLDLPNNNTRHHIPFIMDIEAPPSRVREVAMAAMHSVPSVLRTPSPMVLFKNFVDKGVAYEAIFWHENPNVYILRRDEVGGALWNAFARASLPFAVDRLMVSKRADYLPAMPAVDPALEREQLLAVLNGAEMFRTLPESARRGIVGAYQRHVYGEPELIVRQGDPGSSMFVILSGRVAVLLNQPDGPPKKMAELRAGDSFGEMALMLGEGRNASVQALSQVILAEIPKEAMQPVLQNHPECTELLAQQAFDFQARNEAYLSGVANQVVPAATKESLIGAINARIRRYFECKF